MKTKIFAQHFAKSKLKYIWWLLIVFLFGALAMSFAENKERLPDFHSLKDELPVLKIGTSVEYEPEIQHYFDYYGLNYSGCLIQQATRSPLTSSNPPTPKPQS